MVCSQLLQFGTFGDPPRNWGKREAQVCTDILHILPCNRMRDPCSQPKFLDSLPSSQGHWTFVAHNPDNPDNPSNPSKVLRGVASSSLTSNPRLPKRHAAQYWASFYQGFDDLDRYKSIETSRRGQDQPFLGGNVSLSRRLASRELQKLFC